MERKLLSLGAQMQPGIDPEVCFNSIGWFSLAGVVNGSDGWLVIEPYPLWGSVVSGHSVNCCHSNVVVC